FASFNNFRIPNLSVPAIATMKGVGPVIYGKVIFGAIKCELAVGNAVGKTSNSSTSKRIAFNDGFQCFTSCGYIFNKTISVGHFNLNDSSAIIGQFQNMPSFVCKCKNAYSAAVMVAQKFCSNILRLTV